MSETTTGGGWCIHGVPFGPNWRCGQCATSTAGEPTSVCLCAHPLDELITAALAAIDALDHWDMGAAADVVVGAEACNWHAVMAAIAPLRLAAQPPAADRQPPPVHQR